MKIGNNIRKMREMRDMTQDDMAEKLSMSQNGYSRIERDETDVPFSRLVQISKALEVELLDLISFDSNKMLFNISNNQMSNNQNVNNGTTYVDQNTIQELQKTHQSHVASLEKEIERLHMLLEKALLK